MVKLNQVAGKVIANLSMAVSKDAANKVCYCWLYQPTLPETVKKLRKF